MSNIKFFVMDVDGTLTDGKIYMGSNGEIAKAFDIKDGCGILLILPKINITPVIITARKSRIVENRCRELNITELYQGSKDKLKTLKEFLNKYDSDMSSVAYAGDDLPDIPCMEAVKKAGGVVLCPINAIPEIKNIADYVSSCRAGDGAIRDCINYLSQDYNEVSLKMKIENVIAMIMDGEYEDRPSGVLADGTPYTIQEYNTKEESECILESHRNHIDVQYMIEGKERFKLYASKTIRSNKYYDDIKGINRWEEDLMSSCMILLPGSYIVIMNNILHKGCIKVANKDYVKKMVCKICICNQ